MKVGRKRTEAPGVVARHDRVRYDRGQAKDFDCEDCGGKARDWAQIAGSDGLSSSDYRALCRRCHILYDNPGMTMSEIMTLKRRR